jgi:hypothetical protein
MDLSASSCLNEPSVNHVHCIYQPQFSQTTIAGLEAMAVHFLAKERTIVLSEATNATITNGLMDSLGVPSRGALWSNKPSVSQRIDGFSWLNGVEDSTENRTAYMAYLRKILHIPPNYALVDTHPNKTLLSVELLGLGHLSTSRKVSGTTNVVIAKAEHAVNEAVRNNIEILLELKKPENMKKKGHTPQVIGEHFAASYLNPRHPVVSVLTDLNERWTLFWFASDGDDPDVALYRLCLNGGQATAYARYLLDSLLDNSVGNLPDNFANRQPFKMPFWLVSPGRGRRKRKIMLVMATTHRTRVQGLRHQVGRRPSIEHLLGPRQEAVVLVVHRALPQGVVLLEMLQ